MDNLTRGRQGRLSRLFVLIAIGFLAIVFTWVVMAGGVQASAQDATLSHAISLARTMPDDSIQIEFFYAGNDLTGVTAAADDFANLLSVETGHVIAAGITDCEGIIIDHLGAGQADIAVLSGLAYAFGHKENGIEARLVNGMFDAFSYRSQINVPAASGYNDLWDLQGLRFAATDPSSRSGYMFPYLLISDTTGMAPDAFFSEVSFVGGHDQVILEVYTGAVECGASFEDARSLVVADYSDVFDVVSVLTYTEDIYQDPWVFRQELDSSVVQTLTDGIVAVAGTQEGENDLEAIFGYDLTGIGVVDDSAYDPYRELITAFNVRLDPCYKNYLPIMASE